MDKEKYFDVKGIKGQKQKAIASETAKALIHFCDQEPEFEQAVDQSGKTFQKCLDSVVKGVGTSISDLEAYSKAVKFYFTTAEVHFNMSIDLSGGNGYEAPPITVSSGSSVTNKNTDTAPKPSAGLNISLDDLLDF